MPGVVPGAPAQRPNLLRRRATRGAAVPIQERAAEIRELWRATHVAIAAAVSELEVLEELDRTTEEEARIVGVDLPPLRSLQGKRVRMKKAPGRESAGGRLRRRATASGRS